MNEVTFWTFYTDDQYKLAALRLKRSCDKFGIAFMMSEATDLGVWKKNCNQKPKHLLEAYDKCEGAIVCLDADCIVHEDPTFLREPHPGVDAILWAGGVGRKYISSGVCWWGRTSIARAMLKRWVEECAERWKMADRQLKTVCDEFVDIANMVKIPKAYLKPYWLNKKGVESPVISCNERMTDYKDGRYDRHRKRKDPITPEHTL